MGRDSLPPEIRDAIHSVANLDVWRDSRIPRRRQLPRLESSQDLSWAESTRKRVWQPRTGRRPGAPYCAIFRVPENILEGDPKAYEPTVVSIGPYANNLLHTSHRLRAMEDHKWICIRGLLWRHKDRRRADELLDRCLATMKASESRARRCYSEEIHMNPQAFAEMLLLDGCFILHLLLKQVEGKKVEDVEVVVVVKDGTDDVDDVLEEGQEEREALDYEGVEVEEEERAVMVAGSLWIWSLVKYDLLKLENQIPFFIVQELFNVLRTPADAGVDLMKLALKLFSTLDPHGSSSSAWPLIHAHQVHHLLHLYHASLQPCFVTTSSVLAGGGGGSTTPPEWIPSATELQEAGVRFKGKTDARSMLQVTFVDGVMEIPPLHVYSYSNIVFRNLMAFEQCFPVVPYVTSYALFMDCIMRTARDVRLLHLSGIVMNGQSADEEVARFFGGLRGNVQYAHDVNYLRVLYVAVARYHESRWHKWQAVLKRDYFSNPWVVVSVLAAAVLLLLTVEQAVFAALAYVRPPK